MFSGSFINVSHLCYIIMHLPSKLVVFIFVFCLFVCWKYVQLKFHLWKLKSSFTDVSYLLFIITCQCFPPVVPYICIPLKQVASLQNVVLRFLVLCSRV